MAALLDVNALIALVDSEHVGHEAMQKWFLRHHASGWATCPIVENGMVRVLSQPAYPSGQRTPAEVIQVLGELKETFARSFEFWEDDVSISDDAFFEGALIAGTRQVTDVYLLGLAARRSGTMVSFDRSLTWRAVRNATEGIVQNPS